MGPGQGSCRGFWPCVALFAHADFCVVLAALSTQSRVFAAAVVGTPCLPEGRPLVLSRAAPAGASARPSPSASTALPIAAGVWRLDAAGSLDFSRGASTVITGSRCATTVTTCMTCGCVDWFDCAWPEAAPNALTMPVRTSGLILDLIDKSPSERDLVGVLHCPSCDTRSHVLDSKRGVSHKVGGRRLRPCAT